MVLAVLCTSVVGFLDIAMVAEVEAILVEAGEELRGKLKGAFFGLAELFVVLVALYGVPYSFFDVAPPHNGPCARRPLRMLPWST